MSQKILHSKKWKLILAVIWFLVTFSMVTWWWFFSLQLLEALIQDGLAFEKYSSLRRMILWEGPFLLLFIFCGGVSLLFLTNQERLRNFSLRLFFSNFSHDLKTSLNRLRLRAEVFAHNESDPAIQKLMEEVNRLDLQLDNSLWVARGEEQKLTKESFSFESIISTLRIEWPDLEIYLNKDVLVQADHQALKSVIRNIFQNTVFHGQASRIDINVSNEIKNQVSIQFKDDGKGYSGDLQNLGVELMSVKESQGNGIGLYLTKSLLEKMEGQIEFVKSQTGFCVELKLPIGRVASR
jgi:signal transduction histidine kinase